MITIKLAWPELTNAAMVGCLRQISAIQRNRICVRGRPARSGDWQWDAHIEGACAELAVAKYLGLFWHALLPKLSQRAHPDVGRNIQVKRRPENGRGRDLRLHENDLDDAPYVLVVGTAPTYELRGWILGVDGKQAEYLNPGDGRPCYFVPREKLRPMSDLRDISDTP
jgi:hypothetical protein